jgi:hypothetical protein
MLLGLNRPSHIRAPFDSWGGAPPPPRLNGEECEYGWRKCRTCGSFLTLPDSGIMRFAVLRISWFSKLATHRKFRNFRKSAYFFDSAILATWLKYKGNGRQNSALFHSKTTNRTSARFCPMHGVIIPALGEHNRAGEEPVRRQLRHTRSRTVARVTYARVGGR